MHAVQADLVVAPPPDLSHTRVTCNAGRPNKTFPRPSALPAAVSHSGPRRLTRSASEVISVADHTRIRVLLINIKRILLARPQH